VNAILIISARDNVGTALEPLESGRILTIGESILRVVDDVPRGHKVALREIRAGDPVIKYGSSIGIASARIAAGSHVHTHNVASVRGRGDLMPAASPSEARIAEPPDDSELQPADRRPVGSRGTA
jgi:altronate dehydratase